MNQTMIKTTTGLGVILLIGIGVFLFVRAGSSDGAPSGRVGTSIGDTAPDFGITDSAGARVALSDLLSKKITVITSTASWCPTCIIEAKEFSPVYEEFKDEPIQFLSVSIDPTDDDQKMDQFKIDYNAPWAHTHPGREGVRDMIIKYQLTRFEITYIIDTDGIIRFKDSSITSAEKLRQEIINILSGTTPQELGEAYPDQGRTHIAVGSSHPPYNSNPPTSGWHYPSPAPWGIYREELSDEQIVHNLEHGGVWAAYHPRIGEEQIQFLENLLVSYDSKVIVSPRAANDADLALAAWGRLLKLQRPLVPEQEDVIIQFIETYKNKGPEFVPDMGI